MKIPFDGLNLKRAGSQKCKGERERHGRLRRDSLPNLCSKGHARSSSLLCSALIFSYTQLLIQGSLIIFSDSSLIFFLIFPIQSTTFKVNEEIEANIQVTREIESEIVKCTEYESTLASRESELTKTLYVSQFDIIGLISVRSNSFSRNLESISERKQS